MQHYHCFECQSVDCFRKNSEILYMVGLFSMLIAGVSEISVLVLFSSSNFSWLFIVGSALLFRALTSCG